MCEPLQAFVENAEEATQVVKRTREDSFQLYTLKERLEDERRLKRDGSHPETVGVEEVLEHKTTEVVEVEVEDRMELLDPKRVVETPFLPKP